MALRPPIDLDTFKDLRKLTRWCKEQTVGEEGTVTLEQFADITADRILGRLTSAGIPQELTAAQVVTLLKAVDWAFSGDIGFHGVAATGQQANPGTPSLGTVSGSGDDGTINGNFTAIKTVLDNVVDILQIKGFAA